MNKFIYNDKLVFLHYYVIMLKCLESEQNTFMMESYYIYKHSLSVSQSTLTLMFLPLSQCSAALS